MRANHNEGEKSAFPNIKDSWQQMHHQKSQFMW